MKKAFSRLITFINHLLAYLVSTLVKRWLNNHVIEIHVYHHMVDSTPVVVKSSELDVQRSTEGAILTVVAKEEANDL